MVTKTTKVMTMMPLAPPARPDQTMGETMLMMMVTTTMMTPTVPVRDRRMCRNAQAPLPGHMYTLESFERSSQCFLKRDGPRVVFASRSCARQVHARLARLAIKLS